VASVLAIISKAIFEVDGRLGGRLAGVGDTVPLSRYVSKNKGLAPVASGGALFLVTVRPPDESLWLVAVLESPKHDGEVWTSAPNTVPVADISGIKEKIRFANNTGISAKKGALGMSLQTPRVLSDLDVALLRAAGAAGAAPSATLAPAAPKEVGHLNAHEPSGSAPCLCGRCLPSAPERFVLGSLPLVRERANGGGRFVWYWRPETLDEQRDAVRRAVEARLQARARKPAKASSRVSLDHAFASGGEDDE
jgi:hypothetical protein